MITAYGHEGGSIVSAPLSTVAPTPPPRAAAPAKDAARERKSGRSVDRATDSLVEGGVTLAALRPGLDRRRS